MKQRLTQKQVQKLVMTQDLRQSIQMLQYSALELKDYIENEIIENPFLELTESGDLGGDSQPEDSDRADTASDEYAESASHFDDTSDFSGIPDKEASDRKQLAIENTAAISTGLASHLLEQVQLTSLTEEEKDIAEVLISALDDQGLLGKDFESLVEASGFNPALADKVRKVIASFDPAGCAAVSIQESLIFQAQLLPKSKSVVDAIFLLKNHFEDLADLSLHQLSEKSHLTPDEIDSAFLVIRSLEPVPARQFSSKTIDYVIPDVIVKEVDDTLRVFANDSWIPDLRINDDYAKILADDAFRRMKAADRDYLKTKMSSASFLIKGISQRRETLLRTMTALVDFQYDFFMKGPGNLKPLNLSQVAEALNLHESTVSRITTNKYAETQWGVFELKYFFARGIKRLDGSEAESANSVQDRIGELIANETEPLSDQVIADLLKKEGIRIARRTVAKYRSQLGIAVADQRRLHKKE